MFPSRQPELMRGALSSPPCGHPCPPSWVPKSRQVAGLHPTLPGMMLLTQLRFSCAPHHPAPPSFPSPCPGPLSPGQHRTPVLGRGRKPHRELQRLPPNPTKSCSVCLRVPWAALVSTSKPHLKLQHPPSKPPGSQSIHLYAPVLTSCHAPAFSARSPTTGTQPLQQRQGLSGDSKSPTQHHSPEWGRCRCP